MDTIRAFIAVDLTEAIRQQFAFLQHELKKTGADIRWVKPENIHATLKFLGDTPRKQVPEIGHVLEQIAGQTCAFELGFGGLGMFPGLRRPRILWVGVRSGESSLHKLQTAVERELKPLGFMPEKRAYKPHLTIGRFKSDAALSALCARMEKLQQHDCGQMTVDAVHLVQSTLTPGGSIYEKKYSAQLISC